MSSGSELVQAFVVMDLVLAVKRNRFGHGGSDQIEGGRATAAHLERGLGRVDRANKI
jgi:hypothetical protein